MISDRYGRSFSNLRISLTAACNYACTYCVPDGKRLMPARAELEATEVLRAVDLMIATTGIDKVRLTGGEPLLSPKFDDLMPDLMQRPLRDVSLTTNGQLLDRKADLIIDSGLKRINVSLDTLDPERFRAIARSGDLATVQRGIDRMLDAGISVKLNMVPLRSANRDQVLPMLDYALSNGMELRYIELMKMGHLQHDPRFERDFLGMDELLDIIGSRHAFTRTDAPFDSTAVRFAVESGGTFGIIANESEPFCSSCTRLRLSSNGRLYGCLSSAKSHDIRDLLTLDDEQARERLKDVLGMALADKQPLHFTGEVTVMKFIGG
ncbi:MAG: radical SAM protein [Pseudomonadaceae bacterium]|nr:radical SAM protein [Pseudomonadaceae bacterium]